MFLITETKYLYVYPYSILAELMTFLLRVFEFLLILIKKSIIHEFLVHDDGNVWHDERYRICDNECVNILSHFLYDYYPYKLSRVYSIRHSSEVESTFQQEKNT